MRHVHYDERAGGRVPGYSPLGAYARLLVGVFGAVLLTTVFWAGWANHEVRLMLLRGLLAVDVLVPLSSVWGVELTGNLARDSLAFALTRLGSPFVVWTVVLAGVVAFALAYRRGRFDSVLERRG